MVANFMKHKLPGKAKHSRYVYVHYKGHFKQFYTPLSLSQHQQIFCTNTVRLTVDEIHKIP